MCGLRDDPAQPEEVVQVGDRIAASGIRMYPSS
jgi:hypothetical protein